MGHCWSAWDRYRISANGALLTAANLATGIGIVPPGTFVLSATASNAALMAAGFAPQVTVEGVAWTQTTNVSSGFPRYSFSTVSNSGQM